MLGNNSFYIPDDTVGIVHDAVHDVISLAQDVHDDHTEWGAANSEHLYCGRATIEPAQVDQNYLW